MVLSILNDILDLFGYCNVEWWGRFDFEREDEGLFRDTPTVAVIICNDELFRKNADECVIKALCLVIDQLNAQILDL